jgi:hypothetical protein
MPCAAGARDDGGGGMWVECSKLVTGTERTECRSEGNAVAHERPRVKASRWAVHGNEEVAAGGRSVKSWRARERPLGKRNLTGRGRGRRVEKISAGGGQRCSAAGGRRAEQGPTCARRKKRGERSGGLACDFQKV